MLFMCASWENNGVGSFCNDKEWNLLRESACDDAITVESLTSSSAVRVCRYAFSMLGPSYTIVLGKKSFWSRIYTEEL